MTQKRSRQEGILDISSRLLSDVDVRLLLDTMCTHRSTLLQLFRTEKESDRHKKPSEAITDISNAFSTLAHAYLCKLAVDDLTDHLSDRLDKACDFIEQAGTALSNIQSADGNRSSQVPQTYANAAKRKRAILPGKITLDRGSLYLYPRHHA